MSKFEQIINIYLCNKQKIVSVYMSILTFGNIVSQQFVSATETNERTKIDDGFIDNYSINNYNQINPNIEYFSTL